MLKFSTTVPMHEKYLTTETVQLFKELLDWINSFLRIDLSPGKKPQSCRQRLLSQSWLVMHITVTSHSSEIKKRGA